MDDDLEQLMKSLKLRRIPEILQRELANAEKRGLSYSTLLKRLFREEYQEQQTRAMEYRIARAHLPERWSLATFPWKKQKSLNRKQIEQLAELDFLSRASNVVLIGETALVTLCTTSSSG